MDRVKDKVAIVTGGGSGIGEATAKVLAREGAVVSIVDIDDENGRRVTGEIFAAGGKADYSHLNVAVENDVEQVFSEIYEKYQKLNVLVNNAGIAGGGGASHEITVEQWDSVMDVNLKGPFFCVKHAVPYLKKSGGGSVINVSSIMGIVAGPTPVYCTSKAALRHLTKSDAVVYARDNIRFNSVHPGYIITPLFIKLAEKAGNVEEEIAREGKAIPLGRMGRPEEIANGILFLASDESSYVTGIELIIDGGKVIV
jgi:NAD(P)-dependent dehydrogenase (short-subunit alcohol dehydrogenase family)